MIKAAFLSTQLASNFAILNTFNDYLKELKTTGYTKAVIRERFFDMLEIIGALKDNEVWGGAQSTRLIDL